MKPEKNDKKQPGSGWADRSLWSIKPVQDAIRALVVLVFLAALLWFAVHLRSILIPIFIALIAAYIFDPLFTWAHQRLRIPLAISILLVIAVFLALGIGLMSWLTPRLTGQLHNFFTDIQQFISSPPPWAQEIQNHLPTTWEKLASALEESGGALSIYTENLLQPIFSRGMQALGFIRTIIGTTTYLAIAVGLGLLYFFFFAWHFDDIRRMTEFVPRSYRSEFNRILGKMDEAASGFFRGRLIVALIMCVMFAVGWRLVGVPYALLLGIIAGLLSIIPYAAAAGWLIAIASSLVAGRDLSWLHAFFAPTIVYTVVQFVEGWIITPLIQGKATYLSSVTVITAVLAGGVLGGVFGMILAIPVAACIKILFREVMLPGLREWADRQ